MTDAERTYTNLMIFKIMTSTKGRISVKQIHAAIEPNMGISIRSLQRYLNDLDHWGLVAKDGETPQGFSLTHHQNNFLKTWPTDVMHEQYFTR